MTEQTFNGLELAMDLDRGAALIRFESHNSELIIDSLHRFFDSLKDRPITQILLDFNDADEVSGNMVAFVIHATVLMRRRGGDVKLLNLSKKLRSHFSLFTPLTYCSIGADSALIGHLGEESSLDGFDQGRSNRIRVDASVDALNEIVDFVLERSQRMGFDKIALSKIKIAVYEACMNIIEHAYEFEPGHTIETEVTRRPDAIEIILGDRGKAFNIYERPDYDVESAFNEKREGGFGLYIIRRSMDEIHYKSDIRSGNRLTLVKKIENVTA